MTTLMQIYLFCFWCAGDSYKQPYMNLHVSDKRLEEMWKCPKSLLRLPSQGHRPKVMFRICVGFSSRDIINTPSSSNWIQIKCGNKITLMLNQEKRLVPSLCQSYVSVLASGIIPGQVWIPSVWTENLWTIFLPKTC